VVFRGDAMRFDERARIHPAIGIFAIAPSDEQLFEFTHFKVQMRKVKAMRRGDGRDFWPRQ